MMTFSYHNYPVFPTDAWGKGKVCFRCASRLWTPQASSLERESESEAFGGISVLGQMLKSARRRGGKVPIQSVCVGWIDPVIGIDGFSVVTCYFVVVVFLGFLLRYFFGARKGP